VYGASEGLTTITLDAIAAGGQAATSSRIENYLGFPAGISGAELAERAVIQADKFGARFSVPAEASSLGERDGAHAIGLTDGTSVLARTIIIATGARYRRLDHSAYLRVEPWLTQGQAPPVLEGPSVIGKLQCVVLNCPDVGELPQFYQSLSWPRWADPSRRGGVGPGAGVRRCGRWRRRACRPSRSCAPGRYRVGIEARCRREAGVGVREKYWLDCHPGAMARSSTLTLDRGVT
jgi:hypothetical protein